VLLRVLLLQASHLSLDVGILLHAVRRCAASRSCDGDLPAALKARPS
jgi:hypothetical protein